jgi:hypothetical protein
MCPLASILAVAHAVAAEVALTPPMVSLVHLRQEAALPSHPTWIVEQESHVFEQEDVVLAAHLHRSTICKHTHMRTSDWTGLELLECISL